VAEEEEEEEEYDDNDVGEGGHRKSNESRNSNDFFSKI